MESILGECGMDGAKKKAKMQGLKDLIKQMHKMMAGSGSISEAMGEAEKEMAGDKEDEMEDEEMAESEPSEGGEDLAAKIKEYMKKSSKIPVKGAAVMMQLSQKKPSGKKMKYG